MRARKFVGFYDGETYSNAASFTLAPQNSPLGKFIGSYGRYKALILNRVPQKEELVGRAAEFDARDPHNPFPGDNLVLLQHIRDVLKIGSDIQPKWLRSSGPVAADFKAGRIHTRSKMLRQLREHIFSNSISLLLGERATGKTVLLRQLAHQLYTKTRTNIHLI